METPHGAAGPDQAQETVSTVMVTQTPRASNEKMTPEKWEELNQEWQLQLMRQLEALARKDNTSAVLVIQTPTPNAVDSVVGKLQACTTESIQLGDSSVTNGGADTLMPEELEELNVEWQLQLMRQLHSLDRKVDTN